MNKYCIFGLCAGGLFECYFTCFTFLSAVVVFCVDQVEEF